MNAVDVEVPEDGAGPSTSHLVHSTLHFLRIARYRKNVILTAVLVGAFLGGLYLATATRMYRSDASLLILHSGGDLTMPSMSVNGSGREIMPTYQRLLKSAVVLEGAIRILRPEHRIDFRGVSRNKWIDALGNHLTASAIRQTNLIEVSYLSKDPNSAAAVVSAVIQSYLDFIDRTHRGTAGDIIDILTRQKIQLEEKLNQKQSELLHARTNLGHIVTDRDGSIVHPLVQTAIELNNALVKAQEKRLEVQASLAAVEDAIRKGQDLRQHIMAVEETVGREILLASLGFNSQDANVLADLEKTLLQDRAELLTLSEFYGPAHPRRAEVENRIRITEQYLQNYQTRIDHRLAHLQDMQLGPVLTRMLQQSLTKQWQSESALRVAYAEATREAIQLEGDLARLNILDHDVRRLRNFHDVMINKIAETDLRQQHGDIRATVVKDPLPPTGPASPRIVVVILTCLFGSLAVGGLNVYVLDILDDRFRSPEELKLYLGAPVLAMVRQLQVSDDLGLAGMQTNIAPDAVESEAFRTLRTALALSPHETGQIVISSSEPGDGKTTVLINLAISSTQAGKKTLLIDADLRRPGLTKILGMQGESGLSDLLRSEEDIGEMAAQFVNSTEIDGLDVLPSGPRRPSPAELLSGPRFGDLLAWAGSVYDQVLIDSPPVLAASDAQMIGRCVDGLILVVNPTKNRRRSVVRAAESFTAVGINIVGVVANRIDSDRNSDYGYGYSYGYGYGYGYGYEDTELNSQSLGTSDQVFPVGTSRVETDGGAQGRVVPRRVA